MKYLRMTLWLGRKEQPLTSITPESALPRPVYTAATDLRARAASSIGPAVEIEIHDVPDDVSVEDATMRIIRERPQPLSQEARHKNTLFDWAMDLLTKLKPGGTAQTTEPCPLDITTLTQVLYRVAAAPNYQNQRFNMYLADRTEVSLVNGEVVTSKPA